MLKEFLMEAAAIEAALRSGTEFPDYAADPVADGETKVGVLEDPWLRSLFLAYKARAEALQQGESFDISQLPGPGPDGDLDTVIQTLEKILAESERKVHEMAYLNRIVWTELEAAFSVRSESNLGIRADWTVVTIEQQQRRRPEMPPRFIFADMSPDGLHVGQGEFPSPDGSEAPDCAGCEHLDCPVHPRHSESLVS